MMRMRFGLLAVTVLMLPSLAAQAQDTPKDARTAYSRAHQCFYASGAGTADTQKCHKDACAYVALMGKYKDKPSVMEYLRDHYNNVSAEPYETLAASCK